MTVFAQVQDTVSIYMKIDIRQLINSCSLCMDVGGRSTNYHWNFLPAIYPARLRDTVAGRNSHDVCPIRRVIHSKKMEVFPEALITSAEGLCCPRRVHAPPFADPALVNARLKGYIWTFKESSACASNFVNKNKKQ